MVAGRAVDVVVAPTFGDVAFDHIFHRFVERFADAGITGGCSVTPRLFCPQNQVSRGQMAVFVLAALGVAPDSSGSRSSTMCRRATRSTASSSSSPASASPPAAALIPALLPGQPGHAPPAWRRSSWLPWTSRPTAPGPDLRRRAAHGPLLRLRPRSSQSLGVTGRCSAVPPLFCPDNQVEQGQMAVFLVKAFILGVDEP